MAEIIIPGWEDFRNIVRNANTSLIICCPYYTETGVDNIFDNLRDETSLFFFTRLSPSDWVNGISDPEALVILLELLEDAGRNVVLQIHQRLHAKVYIADTAIALIGSSNLSEGGFGRNFEVMVRLLDTDAEQAWNIIDQKLRSESRSLAINGYQLKAGHFPCLNHLEVLKDYKQRSRKLWTKQIKNALILFHPIHYSK